mgnify:CR=1 FL=1
MRLLIHHGPNPRHLICAVSFGYAVLWPMLRLCQVFPSEGGVSSVGKDLLVVVIPTQAVVWPLAFLAVWPMSVAAALGAQSLAWTLLVGAMLALALGPGGSERRPAPLRRAAWMAVILVVAARPVGMFDFGPPSPGMEVWSMSSSITAPLILFQGLEDRVVPPEQSRRIAESLRMHGTTVACHEFAGEGHGFRRAETIVAVLEAEAAFLRNVLAP